MFLKDMGDTDVNEWEIYDIQRTREIHEGSIPSLVITLYIQRKLVFSAFILTVPIVFLALFTLVVFLMPPGTNNDKASLG